MTDYSPYIMIILECCIFLTLFFQRSESRIYTGSVFFIMLMLHELIFSGFDGIMYYGSSALFYLGIMMLTIPAARVTSLVLDIHRICLFSIIINGFGWLCWYAYLPANLYNLASMILHGCGIWALMKHTKGKENEFRVDWGDMCFRFNYNKSFKYIPQYKGRT